MEGSATMFVLVSSALYGIYKAFYSRRVSNYSIDSVMHSATGALVYGISYLLTCFLGTKINSEVKK